MKKCFSIVFLDLQSLSFFLSLFSQLTTITMNNNRKSPIKQQQRTKNSPSAPVVINSNRHRSNSSMATSYPKNIHSQSRHYAKSNSPTTMSAGSPPAVPVFYSQIYADPPDCSFLPQPPESWYLTPNNEQPAAAVPTPIEKIEDKVKIKPKSHAKKNNNRGFYSPFSTPRPYISVRA